MSILFQYCFDTVSILRRYWNINEVVLERNSSQSRSVNQVLHHTHWIGGAKLCIHTLKNIEINKEKVIMYVSDGSQKHFCVKILPDKSRNLGDDTLLCELCNVCNYTIGWALGRSKNERRPRENCMQYDGTVVPCFYCSIFSFCNSLLGWHDTADFILSQNFSLQQEAE